MAVNVQYFGNVVRLRHLSADPSSPENGMMYYNTSTDKFRVYESGSWKDQATGSVDLTGQTLNASNILVGNGSNVAAAVDTTALGDVTATTTGGLVVNALAITASKIANATITNTQIASGAAIARSKLASGTANRLAYNNGSGVLSDLPAITVDRALVSDGLGLPIASATTSDELAYVSGVTAPIQAQLDGKISSSEKGSLNGVASLGADGFVPSTQLAPIDTDDVSEGLTNLYFTSGRVHTIVDPLIAQEVIDRDDAIAVETARALDAENELQINIDEEATSRVADDQALRDDLDAEIARAEAAEAALEAALVAAIDGLQWRSTALLISADAELAAATEGDTLAAILPLGDDETPIMVEADVPVGSLLLASNGASSKIMKVYSDAGTKKVTFVGLDVLATNDTFIVKNDLLDSPGASENRSIYQFSGTSFIKIGDFDWSLATGINLSASYSPAAGTVTVGDSIEAAIQKIVANLAAAVANNSVAGVGLSQNGTAIDLNAGAGLAINGSDDVIVDNHSSGALFLTVDGTSASSSASAQLAVKLDGSTLSRSSSGLKVADGGIANAQISASAAVDLTKLATVTASRALVSDASGFISPSATTAVELGYLSGVTSSIQTQFAGKANQQLSNLSGTSAVNVNLLPDAGGSRSLGSLNFGWSAAFAGVYRGLKASQTVKLTFASSTTVTIDAASGLQITSGSQLVVNGSVLYSSLFANGFATVSGISGNTITVAGSGGITNSTDTGAYAAYSTSLRTEDETVANVPSGVVNLRTGNTTSGRSGVVTLKSGNASSGGTTGNVNISTGTTSGTRGNVTVDSNMIVLKSAGGLALQDAVDGAAVLSTAHFSLAASVGTATIISSNLTSNIADTKSQHIQYELVNNSNGDSRTGILFIAAGNQAAGRVSLVDTHASSHSSMEAIDFSSVLDTGTGDYDIRYTNSGSDTFELRILASAIAAFNF